MMQEITKPGFKTAPDTLAYGAWHELFSMVTFLELQGEITAETKEYMQDQLMHLKRYAEDCRDHYGPK